MLVQMVCLFLIVGGGLEFFNWAMTDGWGTYQTLALWRGRLGLAAFVLGVLILAGSIMAELARQ